MLELNMVTSRAGRASGLAGASLAFGRDAPTAVLGLAEDACDGFLRLLSGVDRPQSGSVKLDGKDVVSLRREKGRIAQINGAGLVRLGRKTSRRDVSEPGRPKSRNRRGAALADHASDQAFRVAIAKARAARPALVLVDAPTRGLGGEVREKLLADLKGLLADTGAVVVLIAGGADEARNLGGRIVVLAAGKLVQQGPAADVMAHPANLTAALATSFPILNTLPMTIRDGRGELADGSRFAAPAEIAMPREGGCTLAFRPEDTTLERAGAGCLRFVVRASGGEIVGGRSFLRVFFAGERWLTPPLASPPPPGAVLNAFVERSKLMVFDADGNALR
jgi:ABC-type sulfate/molybdate transport systems ATPase subunit